MFKVGSFVKIKKGIIIDGLDVSGWEGRIGALPNSERNYYLVCLDSITMANLTEDYIIETLKMTDIESFNHFYMGENDLEMSSQRDTDEDVENKLDWIDDHYQWKALESDGPDEIVEILTNYQIGSKSWEELLEENLSFPFEAKLFENDRGPLSSVDTVKVTGVEMDDDLHGVIASVKVKSSKYAYPFCDLEPLEEGSNNYMWCRAYSIFYANH